MIIGFLAVAALGVFFFYRTALAPEKVATTTPSYVIEEIPIERPQPPNFNREIKFISGTTAEVKSAVLANVAELTARLKKNPSDFDALLNLGALYKIAGDYEGARLVWEYASAISPANYSSFANLGNLYHNYFKDYPKAETNYLKAIANEKTYIDGYRSLHELYRYSYAVKAAQAPKILEQGIAANPKAVDLMIVLAQYYRDTGDKAKALVYYDKAIAELTTAGDTARLEAVKSERAAL